ncbi:MAG: amidohydrolase [Deltaproteobacteria bacterium]|nr:amidohydrolase [Deltaproteobacteria bacterium]
MRRQVLFLLGFTFFLMLAVSVPAQNVAPDVVYHNGKIVTANEGFTIVQAIAVKDGKIVAVGPSREIRRLAGLRTRQVDLQGKTVLPGFYDNHIHLGEGVQAWKGGLVPAASEWLREADTLDKLLAALKKRAANTPKGQWIRGTLAREDWPNQRVPTRWDVDKVVPDHPVALARGPHTLIVNSMALEKAGITRETPDPPGGWIFRSEDGAPNGRVLEAARRMITRVIPSDRKKETDEEKLARYRQHLQKLAGLGITSVNIAGLVPQDLRLVQELYNRWGEALPRATVMVRVRPGHDAYDDVELGVKNSINEIIGLGFRTGFGNERLKIGGIKMSIDGGMSAPVFWSVKPYKGRPNFYGAQRIPDDAFYRVAKTAHEMGWQIGVHTMGDGAAVMVVNQLEKILKEKPRADHRHHLHHVSVLPPEETLKKMGRLGILVASQPGFTVGLGAYAEEALDPDREASQNPSKTLLNHGIRVSYGSDGAPYGPLVAIWAAVTRTGWDGKIRGPGEAVSLKQAIRMHTYESAYLTFDEKTRGSLEVGKVADMVVLGKDIMEARPADIRTIPIERTIVGGNEIYTAKKPAGAAAIGAK